MELAAIVILYFIAVLFIFFAAKKIYAELYTRETFIYSAFGVFSILMATYIMSDDVGVFTLGDKQAFGQFGDFVGGVLNPIFGFTTIILLLKTLTFQNNEANRTNRKSNAREIRELIESENEKFSKMVIEKVFVRDNQTGDDYSFAMACMNKLGEKYKELDKINNFLADKNKIKFLDVIHFLQDKSISPLNYAAYERIFNEMIFIVDLFDEAFLNEDNDIIKINLLRKYDSFLAKCFFPLGMIGKSRYHELLDLALTSSKLKEDKFKRTIKKIQL